MMTLLMRKYCLNLKQYILSDLPNTFVNQSVLTYIQNRYFVHPKVTTLPTITRSLFYVQDCPSVQSHMK